MTYGHGEEGTKPLFHPPVNRRPLGCFLTDLHVRAVFVVATTYQGDVDYVDLLGPAFYTGALANRLFINIDGTTFSEEAADRGISHVGITW